MMTDIKIGVVTDSHSGKFDNDISISLKDKSVDCIVFLGDVPSNMNASKKEQYEEIKKTLLIYDQLNIPIFWIPGNYEDYVSYKKAFQDLDLKNIRDVSTIENSIHFKGFDLVFLPGSPVYTRGFHINNDKKTAIYEIEDGFMYNFNLNDLKKIILIPEKTILFSHHPCKIEGNNSIDLAIHANYNGQRVVGPYAHELIKERKASSILSHEGSTELTKVIKELNISKFISGDIHEAKAICDIDGNKIKQGSFSEKLFVNPGAAKDGHFGILILREDNKASFEFLSIEK